MIHPNAVDAWLVRSNTAVDKLRLVTPCMLRFLLKNATSPAYLKIHAFFAA